MRKFKKETTSLSDNSKYMTSLKEFDQSDNENNAELFDSIKDCFVTGKWESGKDAANLLDEDDAFGDFEELDENGEGGMDMSDDGFGEGFSGDEGKLTKILDSNVFGIPPIHLNINFVLIYYNIK